MRHLRDLHRGEDAYVLGSGASLDYLDPAFFDGRLTIACNEVALRWRPTRYVVTKYHGLAHRAANLLPDATVVVSRFQHGNRNEREAHGLPPNAAVFDHPHNQGDDFSAITDWPNDPDQLVVSWSTITTAMHLAAHMGAANIIIVGHDCGSLDGRSHVTGYPEPENRGQWLPYPDEAAWLARIELDSIAVRERLRDLYGVRTYSLSPFLNYGLEGVSYTRCATVAV